MRRILSLVMLSVALALALSACAKATPIPTPRGTPTQVAPTPTPKATPTSAELSVPVPGATPNFRLLISDDRNAIGDFQSLVVTISRIGVLPAVASSPTPEATTTPSPTATPASTPSPTPTPISEERERWFEFVPEVTQIDLVELQGENAMEIWGGHIPQGRYLKAFIYVESVVGTLQNGQVVSVKLPSGKLQISKPFDVSADGTVNFVFDITVVAAGSEKDPTGLKYILLPQLAQSGHDQPFHEVNQEHVRQEKEKAKGKLNLTLDGEAVPGATVTLTVTYRGQPVAGATVTLNDAPVGTTDSQGKLSLTISQGIDEVEIKAQHEGREGELDLTLVEGRDKEPQRSFRGTITAITQDTPGNSPWTMSIPGVGDAVTVVVSDAEGIEGTPQVGATVEVKGVLEGGIIYARGAQTEAERGKPENTGKPEETGRP